MRRLAALLAAMVMAGGALLATAAPAQAQTDGPPSYPDGTLQGVYYELSFCDSWGSTLVDEDPYNDSWDFYLCDEYLGFWFLHTFRN